MIYIYIYQIEFHILTFSSLFMKIVLLKEIHTERNSKSGATTPVSFLGVMLMWILVEDVAQHLHLYSDRIK